MSPCVRCQAVQHLMGPAALRGGTAEAPSLRFRAVMGNRRNSDQRAVSGSLGEAVGGLCCPGPARRPAVLCPRGTAPSGSVKSAEPDLSVGRRSICQSSTAHSPVLRGNLQPVRHCVSEMAHRYRVTSSASSPAAAETRGQVPAEPGRGGPRRSGAAAAAGGVPTHSPQRPGPSSRPRGSCRCCPRRSKSLAAGSRPWWKRPSPAPPTAPGAQRLPFSGLPSSVR